MEKSKKSVSETGNYQLYVHVNKANGKMYFGITAQPVSRRWNNGNGYKHCPLFSRAIKKYGWDGFSHIVLLKNLSKTHACDYERYFISRFDSTNPQKGYNCDCGGMGAGTHSEETKEKLKRANVGKKYSSATKDKHREAIIKRGFTFNELARNNSRASRMVPIYQYDINKSFIRKWSSITEAAVSLGVSHQNISRCLSGKSHTCGGFYWSYVDKEIVEPKHNKLSILKVDPITKQVLDSFESVDEASKSTGISKGNICAAYKGRRHTAGGFIWQKENTSGKNENLT